MTMRRTVSSKMNCLINIVPCTVRVLGWGWFLCGRQVGVNVFVHLFAWLVGLVGWLAGQLFVWLVGWLFSWLFGCLVSWLVS